MKLDLARPHLEGLLTFLAVARLGRFTAAAATLGVNHSTVSRRVADLEKSLGRALLVRGQGGWELTEFGAQVLPIAEKAEEALLELSSASEPDTTPALNGVVRLAAPDAFSVFWAIPALARLQRAEPGLVVEIITATQQVRQRRSGVDIEVVIGEPDVNKAVSRHILDYRLKMYATRSYLDRAGTPRTLEDLAGHRINYYIESALQVNDLDMATRRIPRFLPGISSTNVFAHLSSTLSGAGIGILPEFAVAGFGFVPVLPGDFTHPVSYWAVVRNENVRNPAVRACLACLIDEPRSRGAANVGGPLAGGLGR